MDYIDYKFYTNDDRTGTLRQYTLEQVNVHVPHVVGGYPVNAVGRGAFSYIDSPYYIENKIESIEFEEGYIEIHHDAFKDCPKLTKLILPSTIERIYGNPFEGCPNLKSIEFPNGSKYFVFENGKLMSSDKSRVYYEVEAE